MKQCEDDSNLVKIEITLGEKPWDSYWDLREQGTDIIILDALLEKKMATIVKEVCKPVRACYLFRLVGTYDVSALIFLDGIQIANATTKTITAIGESACNRG